LQQIKQKLKAIARAVDTFFAQAGSAIVSWRTDKTKTAPPPTGERRKLYIDTTYIYSTHINTGIQRVVRNIIRHIPKHAEEQEVELITAALVNGAFIRIDRQELESFRRQSKLKNILQRVERKIRLYFASFFKGETLYEDDIVLMLDSSWHLHVWPSVDYAKERGAKVIGVTYDLIPVTHPQFCDDVMEHFFTSWYLRSTDYFDGYLSISKTVMHNLTDYFKAKGIKTEKYLFDSFTLGADFDRQKDENESVRESLKTLFEKRSPIYLTVSTIEPRKNHRFVFEAFKKLWCNNMSVNWVIVGRPGWKTEELQKEMREHKAYQDTLWILNDLNDAELQYSYQHARALVFPSIVEGYGLPIIESLKSGLPVLASDTPIHREVGKENILYFDLSQPDSLVSLISEIEKGERIPKEVNAESIAQPTWDQSAKELLEKTIAIANYGNRGGKI